VPKIIAKTATQSHQMHIPLQFELKNMIEVKVVFRSAMGDIIKRRNQEGFDCVCRVADEVKSFCSQLSPTGHQKRIVEFAVLECSRIMFGAPSQYISVQNAFLLVNNTLHIDTIKSFVAKERSWICNTV
jgi:hypothetical protein